jgi:hypothetical protein
MTLGINKVIQPLERPRKLILVSSSWPRRGHTGAWALVEAHKEGNKYVVDRSALEKIDAEANKRR